ncbi:MAG: glycosyltransferase [Desulfobulbaceae bacterium]|nr:glycosyltransferase [Desulfobulbaceae bacterium]
MDTAPQKHPDLSLVIPIYNEEEVLPTLFARLYPVLAKLDRSCEVIFVDDGSRDRSAALLADQYRATPEITKVVYLRANAGQHAAITAGFEEARGEYVVTLDADLQNPPEELPKLIAEIDRGHDYVGTIRRQRRDVLWRHLASMAMNRLREKITRIHMTDQGCMFRAYHREIIQAVLASEESQTFIPALAYLYAANPVEVLVDHEERAAGVSKYSLFKLIHLNFDLMTSFSLMPLQFFSLTGMATAVASIFFVIFLAVRRLIVGPEAEGLFTLFGIAFFLIGITLFGIGLLGEYVGRIYTQVRKRPRFLVRQVLGGDQRREGEAR